MYCPACERFVDKERTHALPSAVYCVHLSCGHRLHVRLASDDIETALCDDVARRG
jgi:hypothetical protein